MQIRQVRELKLILFFTCHGTLHCFVVAIDFEIFSLMCQIKVFEPLIHLFHRCASLIEVRHFLSNSHHIRSPYSTSFIEAKFKVSLSPILNRRSSSTNPTNANVLRTRSGSESRRAQILRTTGRARQFPNIRAWWKRWTIRRSNLFRKLFDLQKSRRSTRYPVSYSTPAKRFGRSGTRNDIHCVGNASHKVNVFLLGANGTGWHIQSDTGNGRRSCVGN